MGKFDLKSDSEARQVPLAAEFDALVVGAGIAGLRAAIELATGGGRVAVLTKGSPTQSSSHQAQGGIAVALSEEDRVELHFQDTLVAGAGLCNEEAVRILVEEGPSRIGELIEWGTRFDREGTRLAFGREGAHSRKRILHAHGDSTGKEIVRALLARARALPSLTFLDHTFSIDLVLDGDRCVGLLVLDESSREVRVLLAGAVLLATGGAGRLFRETTNPPQATGDGVAMAYRAGAVVTDLEFVQFHPTALFAPEAPRFLLSEALRGEGALLCNAAGERFMVDHHPQAELAPRDIVSRAIFQEIERTGESCVYLDLVGRDPHKLRQRFPRIYETCLQFGFDLARDRIPVHPSAHYLMGGVQTDLHGRTRLPALFAAGEVACTGVHGANRLASNSLLEGLVYGARAGETMMQEGRASIAQDMQVPHTSVLSPRASGRALRDLADVMWTQVGIRRSESGLDEALSRIEQLEAEPLSPPRARKEMECRNLVQLGGLVASAARERRESRGGHYRTDYPQPCTDWSRQIEQQAPRPILTRPLSVVRPQR